MNAITIKWKRISVCTACADYGNGGHACECEYVCADCGGEVGPTDFDTCGCVD